MRKPLIGLTPAHDIESGDVKARPTYMRALKAAGAIPVIMPLDASEEDLKQLSQELDGFLFTGGTDVHPFLFGEETQEHCGNVSPARDQMEISLLPMIMELRKPVLGICRGIQVLNIALGGNIWQDIPSQVKRDFSLAHSQPFHYDMPCHTVSLTKGSLLARISGCSSLKVNSMHHQAVKDLAPPLRFAARSADGLAECVWMPGKRFFLGVQWHPEYLSGPESGDLFRAFLGAARG